MDILVERLFPDRPQLPTAGFLIRSTAPINVEDEGFIPIDRDQPTIHDVIEQLYQSSKTSTDLSIVIAMHGYNTGVATPGGRDGVVEGWYQPMCLYANEDAAIQKKRDSALFLGYRWPSESLANRKLAKEAYTALPILLSVFAYGGMSMAIASLFFLETTRILWFVLPISLGFVSFSIILSLFLLRVSIYFRDTYRASQYGVPDLIELIRQLDQGLIQRKVKDSLSDDTLYERITSRIPEAKEISQTVLIIILNIISSELDKKPDLVIDPADLKFQWFFQKLKQALPIAISDELLLALIQRWVLIKGIETDQALRYWQQRPIQLSFLGHSMGGSVTAQVIRILSDIFDARSVGSIGAVNADKVPSSRVGRVFRLGRLVLVAPDIPVLTITSGRSNVLRSALRRFEEAYLFSSEGDLALRIASTAANYFSYPAKSRTQGYRLGNVTVCPKDATRRKSRRSRNVYGILNQAEVSDPTSHLLEYLEASVLNQDRTQRLDPNSQQQAGSEYVASETEDRESIADLFTFFDCTEYRDRTDYNPNSQQTDANVLVLNGQQSPLWLWNYLRLFIGFGTFSPRRFPKGGRDVHGGYLAGRFCKLLMYRLSFLGLQGLLDSLVYAEPSQFDIAAPIPEPLQADLARVRQQEATTGLIVAPKGDSTLLEPSRRTQLQEKRSVALDYLSWLCAQKHLQVVLSPERYQVDVLGRDRDDVRESLLLRKKPN
jgi:pimeloyl-ACP methyl ester carboxylesterase